MLYRFIVFTPDPEWRPKFRLKLNFEHTRKWVDKYSNHWVRFPAWAIKTYIKFPNI